MIKISTAMFLLCLLGCGSQQISQTHWKKSTGNEQSRQANAVNLCRVQANKEAGLRPVSQPIPVCSTTHVDPICSMSQGNIYRDNTNAQANYNRANKASFNSCMYEKGYEEG